MRQMESGGPDYRVTPEGMAYYEEKCKEWEVTKEVIDKFIVRKG